MSLTTMTTQLRALTGISTTEAADAVLDNVLTGICSSLDETVSPNAVISGSAFEYVVMLQGQIDVLQIRLNQNMLKTRIKSEFGDYYGQMFAENAAKAIPVLQKRLDKAKAETGFGGAIMQSSHVSYFDPLGVALPSTLQEAPDALVLSAVVASGVVKLDWTASTHVSFVSYEIWRGDTAGLYDKYLETSDGTHGIVASASLRASIHNQQFPFFKEEPSVSQTYYYVVKLNLTSGLYSVSNEVTVAA